MGGPTIKISLASLVLAGAAVSLGLTFYPWPPRLDAAPHEALGQAVAQETIRLLGSGGRILLICRDTRTFLNPAADAQVRSFTQSLEQAGVRVGSTNRVKLDPLRLVGVPPGDFFQILKRASDADVVVSFLGPAVLNDEQISKLGDKPARVIAVCTGNIPAQVNLKRLFEQKLLQAAVISRPARATTASGPARFDQLFTMVKPGDLSELPAPAPEADRR